MRKDRPKHTLKNNYAAIIFLFELESAKMRSLKPYGVTVCYAWAPNILGINKVKFFDQVFIANICRFLVCSSRNSNRSAQTIGYLVETLHFT